MLAARRPHATAGSLSIARTQGPLSCGCSRALRSSLNGHAGLWPPLAGCVNLTQRPRKPKWKICGMAQRLLSGAYPKGSPRPGAEIQLGESDSLLFGLSSHREFVTAMSVMLSKNRTSLDIVMAKGGHDAFSALGLSMLC